MKWERQILIKMWQTLQETRASILKMKVICIQTWVQYTNLGTDQG